MTTVQLDGSASFDPDPEGSIATYRWEVVTEAYQWVEIDDDDSATASFEVPSAELAARYGPSIEFRLTITDSGTPPATVTATVVFNLNRGPVADITVSAKLPAPRGTQAERANGESAGHPHKMQPQNYKSADKNPFSLVAGQLGNYKNRACKLKARYFGCEPWEEMMGDKREIFGQRTVGQRVSQEDARRIREELGSPRRQQGSQSQKPDRRRSQ